MSVIFKTFSTTFKLSSTFFHHAAVGGDVLPEPPWKIAPLNKCMMASTRRPVPKAQSIMCLTADPAVTSLIPAWSHTFAEIDHEIISTAIFLPSVDSRRVFVSYKGMYVHKVQ